jgi:hypothetical protein
MCVDWLIELVDVFDMFPNSAFLAVAYADRYLSVQRGVARTQLQLVAAACLHMASKCEDTAYISVNDLVSCSDNLYTSVEVLAMEEQLLTTLNFRLSVLLAHILCRMYWLFTARTYILPHVLTVQISRCSN